MVDSAIATAERYAAGSVPKSHGTAAAAAASDAAGVAETPYNDPAARAASRAAAAAARAAAGAANYSTADGDDAYAADTTAGLASADAVTAAADAVIAATAGVNGASTDAFAEAVRVDHGFLVREAKLAKWDYGTAIPLTLFGELWPQGLPSWAAGPSQEAEDRAKLKELLSMSVKGMKFSARTDDCLERARIATLGQLVTRTEGEMLPCLNGRENLLRELNEKLATLGLTLGMTFDPELVDPPIEDDLAFDVWIDPGQASVEEIQALFHSLSDLNRAHGGNGLTFVSDKDRVLVLKEA